MAREVLNPSTVAPPCNPTYSMAAITEGKRLLFIAGQVAVDRSGALVGHDIETQARQVFENLRLILEAAGATLDDVVNTDVFLVDIARDLEGYLRVRQQYFPHNPPPSTLIQVPALVSPDYLIEIKAVAALHA
jgi:enamine deaminase RidA (YjgF/YER057c/UK114 family)